MNPRYVLESCFLQMQRIMVCVDSCIEYISAYDLFCAMLIIILSCYYLLLSLIT